MQGIKPLGQPPKVWQQIEKKDKNGKTMKFTIQEIPEDRYEDAIQHMCTYFLADEPTCQCLNSKDDPLFVQDISTLWSLLLAEGISVAAFVDNSNGGKPIIAGMNALGVEIKNQKNNLSDYQFKSEKSKNTYEILASTKLVYERYGIDKYLGAIGLSVHPDYRGYGLSKDLLKGSYRIYIWSASNIHCVHIDNFAKVSGGCGIRSIPDEKFCRFGRQGWKRTVP